MFVLKLTIMYNHYLYRKQQREKRVEAKMNKYMDTVVRDHIEVTNSLSSKYWRRVIDFGKEVT